ncbi:sialidase/neuraminidase family protein [Spirosoma radiotolerans]|uniref:Exo-alpha-sialidase n=1 Tax=Spirosoma radiotolerans TaxID=1379870 RepID=A0A0E3ZRQ8_9BACT|nr:hypothetical protein [Spirosoma radiotolerans]AKD53785.1 hypothetical protein SD10_01580 [Spirosoma radiotolerans]
MTVLLHLLLLFSSVRFVNQPFRSSQRVGAGHLPVLVADTKGQVHIVYGLDSTIYYAVASQTPDQFNPPMAVAKLPHLVAGAKRGPQLAVTERYVVITAVNQMGDLFAYSLDRQRGRWSAAVRINDIAEVAKEGFQAVTGASDGTFHAVWLDLRQDKANKIVMATSPDGGRTWSANQVVYRSPSGSVCECCKVSIAANQSDVYIQFRNWLNGSRDLYLAHSTNGGTSFGSVQKLGSGTWKLNACPMDGGAVSLSPTGQPFTVWRRENTLYTCRPGEPEQAIGTGRNVTTATDSVGRALAWNEGNLVWLKLDNREPIRLGTGQMPSVALVNGFAICAWEADGQVVSAVTAR